MCQALRSPDDEPGYTRLATSQMRREQKAEWSDIQEDDREGGECHCPVIYHQTRF